MSCLSLFSLLQQNTTDWVAYQQQTFMSHSSEFWESKIKVWGDSVSGEGQLLRGHPFTLPSHGGRYQLALWGLFYKGTNPNHEAFPSRPNHLPKAPLPNAITLGVRIST